MKIIPKNKPEVYAVPFGGGWGFMERGLATDGYKSELDAWRGLAYYFATLLEMVEETEPRIWEDDYIPMALRPRTKKKKS